MVRTSNNKDMGCPLFLTRESFARIFGVLHDRGYTVIGPRVDQEAIVYDHVDSMDDLPRGWTDEQAPGSYRLKPRDDEAVFGYAVGPHSWKQFLFPPQAKLSEAQRTSEGWQFQDAEEVPPKYAFLGVRACEIAAMQVQDRVFLAGPYVDPIYQRRRSEALILAVNCTQAASTCFCTSMDTGPVCKSGFDIALTELQEGFVVESATQEGAQILAQLTSTVASEEQQNACHAAQRRAAAQIQRQMDTRDLRNVLLSSLDHPRWDQVAERCLSCTNCTMVCPTCFCSSVDEVSDLAGERVERHRHWDSCFNIDFSYINGGNVRGNIRSRYRQWLTHKLASWIDQFDTSGCVGCGRCITWCPVGIDLTEEVAALREDVS